MKSHRALFMIVLASALLSGSTASAQGGARCRPVDDVSTSRIAILKKFITAATPRLAEARQGYQLTAVTDTNVTYVTDETICAQAADAYNAKLATSVQRSGRTVYVWKAGDRYIVEDPSPDARGGEFTPAMVMDLSFTVLAILAH